MVVLVARVEPIRGGQERGPEQLFAGRAQNHDSPTFATPEDFPRPGLNGYRTIELFGSRETPKGRELQTRAGCIRDKSIRGFHAEAYRILSRGVHTRSAALPLSGASSSPLSSRDEDLRSAQHTGSRSEKRAQTLQAPWHNSHEIFGFQLTSS